MTKDFLCLICEQTINKYQIGDHLKKKHLMNKMEYELKFLHNGINPICKCGCGLLVPFAKSGEYSGKFRDYLIGHKPHANLGKKANETARQKMSISHKKRIANMSQAQKEQMVIGIKNSKRTPKEIEALIERTKIRFSNPKEREKTAETFRKTMVEFWKEKGQTEEYRNSLREAQIKRFANPEIRKKYSEKFSGDKNPRWNPDRERALDLEFFSERMRASLRKAKHLLLSNCLDVFIDELGYTVRNLKEHLESKFIEGMNWKNWGTTWHIDHIVPVSRWGFDSLSKDVNALTNLRPLFAFDNLSKSNKLDEELNI